MAGQDDLGSKLNDINFQGGNTIDEARAPTTPQSDLVMGNCSQCGEQTSKHCTGCKDAPPYGTEDDSSITFFCGQECQLAGWRNHQNLCKRRHLRKKLRLAAWMIDIAWHKYREKVYDFAIDRVENKDGMLLAYESDRKAWLEKEGNYVWQFPQSLVANDEDKRALLDLKVDIDAFADMHELISPLMQMLCKNVYVDVKEIFHPVSGVKRTVRLCTPSSDNLFSAFKHNSLRLVLRNGEVWVIDITGSQYGWTEICTPWDDYKKAKISTAGKTDEDPFGSSHSHMATLAFPQCKHPVLGMIRFSQQHLAEHFHRLVRTWLKDKATDVPGLLKMDEKKARELFVSAVDHATEGLKEVYEWLSENVKVEVVDPAEVADPNKVAAEMKVAEKRFKDNERNKFMKKNKNVQWDEAEENGLRVGQAQDGVLRVGGRTLRLGKGCKVFMD